eukprot:CAMPEP_0185021314 /NCGR_PEP_ID=MMETSP1103-20130426/4002_1 /TAXON_ID=36769 /ORGANISM="Paraphysomonas bandaiensis, Strain Caron Lab Isolate" /LENGTH=125 /DNA_ID=CAMNT_0027552759 /DNA_START=27 /DNA_END=405 /DNA_ORIENTATION=-
MDMEGPGNEPTSEYPSVHYKQPLRKCFHPMDMEGPVNNPLQYIQVSTTHHKQLQGKCLYYPMDMEGPGNEAISTHPSVHHKQPMSNYLHPMDIEVPVNEPTSEHLSVHPRQDDANVFAPWTWRFL